MRFVHQFFLRKFWCTKNTIATSLAIPFQLGVDSVDKEAKNKKSEPYSGSLFHTKYEDFFRLTVRQAFGSVHFLAQHLLVCQQFLLF